MKANLGRIVAQSMTKAAEGRTIEVITGELLEAKQAGGEAILTIGRCLIEAKESLSHGEWLPWLNERAELSERAAQRFMRLAREWSNPTALSDLGATKAITLLALPPEEREQFMEDHNVIDMTTRQLEQAVKERDEARKAAEEAKADAATAEKARAKMAEDMGLLKARLNGAQEDREQAVQEAVRLEKELHTDIPIVSFVAYSGTGKTTFLERLIPKLKARGLKIAIVKHDGHRFEIDHEGKDSDRFTKAGADVTGLISSEKAVLIENRQTDPEEFLKKIDGVDLILTEGFKQGPWPKIMLHRKGTRKPMPLLPEECLAVISDVEILQKCVPTGRD